ncbi:MAG: TetR/AcrR family transcriptional regulator [bacterium]
MSRADDTKAKIVEVVMKIIVRDGINNLTTRKICEEVGIAKGTLYHHFENMDNVVAESIRSVHAQMLEHFEKMEFDSIEQFFHTLGQASISAVEEQKRNGFKIASFFDEFVNNPVLYKLQKELLKDWHNLICSKIQILTEEDISDKVLKEIGTMLYIVITGFKMILYFEDDIEMVKKLWKKHSQLLSSHVGEDKWRRWR